MFWLGRAFAVTIYGAVAFLVVYAPLIFDLDPTTSNVYLATLFWLERAAFYLRNKVI